MIRRHATFRIWALIAAALSAVAIPGAAAQSSAAAAAAVPAPTVQDAAGTVLIGNSLRLVVGRSMFINTKERLVRVYVSNPDVLDSMTSSPRQIVVTAKAPGETSLILWDEGGHTHSWQITADMDVSDLREALRSALPMEDIHAEGREDSITLSGIVSSPAVMDQAVKLAGLYTKNVANSMELAPQHAYQVRLKVRVVEIDRSKEEELGFNFFGTGKNTFNTGTGQYPAVSVQNTTVTSPSGTTTTTTGSPAQGLLSVSQLLNLFYYNNALGVGGAIQALINDQILQILAEPTITEVSGQTASFLSGGEFPVPVVQGATAGFTAVTIQWRPYGVRLEFTPNVLPDGTIQLKVAPEVSALDYTNAVTISGFTIPALSTRRAQTEVELKSGQSFVISGLLDNRTTDLLEKVPGIGDIPILGKLFQSKSSTHSVDELAVIVTPTLVNPLAENPPVRQPKMVVPFLDDQKFDRTLGGGIVPKGEAPQVPSQPAPQ
ncbi:MAG TPA: pilus assembly protein N-terminal domain-containing protein [Acidobacteriaceae bacterium]|nr:pilus assembly protein N-terminal domain-containing protein [Acidobacteriaceae bacterium]